MMRALMSPERKGESRLFLRKFMRHGTRVASVAPSSRILSTAMCESIEARRRQTIVELGAGTGPVTEMSAARMHPASRLIAVEIDPDMAAITQRRCPQATVICCDVSQLQERLRELGVDRIDVMLSGLPVPSLPRSVNTSVLECMAVLGPEAVFSQLTVMPWVFRPMYERLFQHVRFRLVMRNLPPGGVYHCRGLRADWRLRVPGKV